MAEQVGYTQPEVQRDPEIMNMTGQEGAWWTPESRQSNPETDQLPAPTPQLQTVTIEARDDFVDNIVEEPDEEMPQNQRGFILSQIPTSTQVQRLPIMAYLISAYQLPTAEKEGTTNKTKRYWIWNTTFGDLQGRLLKVTFWNAKVWEFNALDPKRYDLFLLDNVEIRAITANQKFNSGNLNVVGHVNEHSGMIRKLADITVHSKIRFTKIANLNLSVPADTLIDLRATVSKILSKTGNCRPIKVRQPGSDAITVMLWNEWADIEVKLGDNLMFYGLLIQNTGFNYDLQQPIRSLSTVKYSRVLNCNL